MKVGAGVLLEELSEDVLDVVVLGMLAELLGVEAGDAEPLAPLVSAVELADEGVVREPEEEPVEIEEELPEFVDELAESEDAIELELAASPRELELAEPTREPEAVETPEDAGLVQAADAAWRLWCPLPICASVASHSCSYFWSSNHTRQIAFC